MKRFLGSIVLSFGLVLSVGAEGLEDWVTAHSATKVADLTVGDVKALLDLRSVQQQELWYVHGAGMSSFLLPGLGQFKAGDTVGGTLGMAGFTALTAATLVTAWSLLPGDLRSFDLSHEARRSLMREYWNDEPNKLYPALGVAVGGAVASFAYRLWSASDAKRTAEDNLSTDKVVFEPASLDGHFGFRMRM